MTNNIITNLILENGPINMERLQLSITGVAGDLSHPSSLEDDLPLAIKVFLG